MYFSRAESVDSSRLRGHEYIYTMYIYHPQPTCFFFNYDHKRQLEKLDRTDHMFVPSRDTHAAAWSHVYVTDVTDHRFPR